MSQLRGRLGQRRMNPYRYMLTREWDEHGDKICWVMLNPSTADETLDDPTIRRVRSFSQREGYGSLVVVNLYAMRATDPKGLIGSVVDNVGHVTTLTCGGRWTQATAPCSHGVPVFPEAVNVQRK